LGTRDAEEAKLHARKSDYERELNSLKLALTQMEMEISRLQADIGVLGKEGRRGGGFV
jgi:chromosome segregation ATPase